MTALNRYVTGVGLLGVAVLAYVLATASTSEVIPQHPTIYVFVVCLVIGECMPMRMVHNGIEGEITTSSTFAVALLLTAGLPLTLAAMAVAGVIADLRQRKSVSRMLFNIGQLTLTVVAAGGVLRLVSGFNGTSDTLHPSHLPGAILAAVTFFIVNALLVSRAVSLAEGTRFLGYLRTDLVTQTQTVGILLGLGPVVVVATQFSVLTLPLLGLPLFALYRAGRGAVQHQHDALHDPLTDLPNRALLRQRLEQALTLREREGGSLAVMFIDLDGFKEVNDTLGHQQGDALLRDVSARLRASLREEETLARLGGDEFAIVVPRVGSPDDAVALARRLGDVLEPPFPTEHGLDIEVRGSFGVALAPQDGLDAENLLRRADIAMYHAKHTGGGERRYDPNADTHSAERLTLVSELRSTLDREGLEVHFQPKARAVGREVESVEALVRWPHPNLGMLGPDRFIEAAERAGLIRQVTSLVLERSLAVCREWLDAGHEIGVAVNLSPDSLRDHRIVSEVATRLYDAGVPARLLSLEVTEGMLVHEPELARDVLAALRSLGVEISLDDFGTGYSSLKHLKDLPIDAIKIDRSFVSELATTPTHLAIVRSLIVLGHDLGLRVVAEGVETEEVADALQALGADLLQGFLIGRPVPAQHFGEGTGLGSALLGMAV